MKYTIKEYGEGIELSRFYENGISESDLYSSIDKTNNRILSSLNTSRKTLKISDGRLRALGVAGIIRINNQIELEIIPKFINYTGTDEWQSTLYMLATLSKHGDILTGEKIYSSTSYINSLYDIAGRILAQEYLKNSRKIMRQYNRQTFCDYAIDGDIKFDLVFEKNPDGIEQTLVRFDRLNAYNATIQAAMKIVKPHVSDTKTTNILENAIADFGKQPQPIKNKQSLSPRNKSWQISYDLSYDILNGFGSSFYSGKIVAPGFIVNTWQLWEWLITSGLSLGYGRNRVTPQACTEWGYKEILGRRYRVNVFPDVKINQEILGETREYLVDAKYKSINSVNAEIDRNDLYEAYAFCKASQCNVIILAYPADDLFQQAGNVTFISTYHVGDVIIHVTKVCFGDIHERGGIYSFGQNLASGINQMLLEL